MAICFDEFTWVCRRRDWGCPFTCFWSFVLFGGGLGRRGKKTPLEDPHALIPFTSAFAMGPFQTWGKRVPKGQGCAFGIQKVPICPPAPEPARAQGSDHQTLRGSLGVRVRGSPPKVESTPTKFQSLVSPKEAFNFPSQQNDSS